MSNNPLYLFFSTPASFGPFFLRLMVAAIFFYQGAQKTFGYFGGQGWQGTISAWEASGIPYFIIILAMLLELLISVALFFGLLTRLAGLATVLVMIGDLAYVYDGSGLAELQFPLLLLVSGLSLFFMGGGKLSVDRAISQNLLPQVG